MKVLPMNYEDSQPVGLGAESGLYAFDSGPHLVLLDFLHFAEAFLLALAEVLHLAHLDEVFSVQLFPPFHCGQQFVAEFLGLFLAGVGGLVFLAS
jgi:hypothetical protein